MDPINYLAMVPQQDFTRSIMGGLQAGSMLRQVTQAEQQRVQQQQVQQQYMGDVQKYMTNPTAEGAAALSLKYPAQREAIATAFKDVDGARHDNEIRAGNMIYGALNTGRPDVAAKVLSDRITSMTNAGQDASNEQHMLDMLQSDPTNGPKQLQGMLGYSLAALDPKFAENHAKMTMLPAEVAAKQAGADKDKAEAAAIPVRTENDTTRANADALTAEANSRNVSSQILERAQRVGLDRDKLTSDIQMRIYELGQKQGQLGDGAIKEVNAAVNASVAAEQSAGQTLDLANRLEKLGGGNGGFTSGWEWLKKAGGWQGEYSAARNDYTRLRNSAAVKSLPAGSASDKDVAIAMQGFPPESADATYIASFLRGLAKLQQREAVFEDAKAQWVNSVGHLGRPKTDIEIDGRKVPAGMTFPEFAKNYIDGKVKESLGAKTVQSRSYMRFATPAPAGGVAPGALGSGTYGIPQGQ